MGNDNPFQWLGEQIGRVLRLIVNGLSWLLTHIGAAFNSVYRGFGNALGIDPTLISLIIVLVGLALLLSGLRALFAGRLFGAVLAGVPGILLLSWLIH